MPPHAFARTRFGKVLLASGHMTDAPDRVAKGRGERFPERKSEAVRDRVAAQLDEWEGGGGRAAYAGPGGGGGGAKTYFRRSFARSAERKSGSSSRCPKTSPSKS